MTADFNTCRLTKGGNIITPKARMSFPNLFRPRAAQGSDKEKFGVALLIPPTADVKLLKDAAAKAAKEKWGDNLPSKLKSPFLDAGDHDREGYDEGWLLVRASTLQRPGIVNAAGANVTEESEVYPGRWCLASLNAFAYDSSGNRGVSFGLQNVQVLDHDEPIGGRSRPEDDFESVADESAEVNESADSIFS